MDQLDPQQLMPESSGIASSLQTQRDFRWNNTLAALADPSLDPLFWRAERLGAESAWWEHVPFAHWIVCATSPRVLVELGTHAGVSTAPFAMRSRAQGSVPAATPSTLGRATRTPVSMTPKSSTSCARFTMSASAVFDPVEMHI